MIPDTDWIPRETDVLWQQSMIRILRENAAWAVPMSGSVFKISNKNKTFKLSVGDSNDETNKRIAKVFKILGYTEVDGGEIIVDEDSTKPLTDEGNN